MLTTSDDRKGIELLFPLLGGDPHSDYRYGFFTSEESLDSFFQIAFNSHSKLFGLGIEPELIIIFNSKTYREDNTCKIEEKRFIFFGRNDYDEQKTSWYFPIADKAMQIISEAECITAVEIKAKHFRLDLFSDSPDTWSAFFRAGVAQCLNEENDSRELLEFCLQYGLAKKKLQLGEAVEARIISASYLATIVARPAGSIDEVLQ